MFSDATIDVNRVIDPSFCDEQCEEIRSKLEEVLLDSDASSAQKRSFPMFDGNEENEEPYEAVAQTDEYAESSKPTADRTQKSNGCQLGEIMNTQNYIEDVERFVPIGNCTLRGEEMWDDFEKLCSSCNGVYSLSENCFPRFVNSIICDQQDTSCIFDRSRKMQDEKIEFYGNAKSRYKVRLLMFTVSYDSFRMCEDWIFRFIEIPVGCECYLSKTSFLDSVPRLNN
ncbi:hypothetical protein M3Y98_00186400 [Aphelenchoides besseyi]|nr:hypothetical protein M3Y98_00186400 [Aphelenchoides besseyi]